MSRGKLKSTLSLAEKYPPSPPCSCTVCLGYCARPGWWTVAEAARAIQAGYARRMMLEMSPDRSFGVLSPAFKGNEVDFALQRFAGGGCTFLKAGLCELHGTGFEPLECCFCHHERIQQGQNCHKDIELDWNTAAGQSLVVHWSRKTGFLEKLRVREVVLRGNGPRGRF
jgi:hypothetical protein